MQLDSQWFLKTLVDNQIMTYDQGMQINQSLGGEPDLMTYAQEVLNRLCAGMSQEEAQFLPKNCIVFQEGTPCGRCAKACPTRAVTLRRTGAPKLNASLCIGCGACQRVCPAPEKAMVIREVEEQTLLPS